MENVEFLLISSIWSEYCTKANLNTYAASYLMHSSKASEVPAQAFRRKSWRRYHQRTLLGHPKCCNSCHNTWVLQGPGDFFENATGMMHSQTLHLMISPSRLSAESLHWNPKGLWAVHEARGSVRVRLACVKLKSEHMKEVKTIPEWPAASPYSSWNHYSSCHAMCFY